MPAPSDIEPPGIAARRVMRAADRAALATVAREVGGWPYPSLVLAAFDHDATPLLLISRLAEHTRNLAQDSRAGLLFDGTGGLAKPLAGPRVSVIGRVEACESAHRLNRYLARHPSTRAFTTFGDFGLYRLAIEQVHWIAGFGQSLRLDTLGLREGLTEAVCAELAQAEPRLLACLEREHRAAVSALAGVAGSGGRCRHKIIDPEAWRVTGIDPDGCDMTGGRGRSARLAFPRPVASATAALEAVLALAEVTPEAPFRDAPGGDAPSEEAPA